MNRQTLPINEIKVIDRQRQDLGDMESLCESILRYGLIQPVVVNADKRLIAGGRRLEAHKRLGKTIIDVVYRETLTEDELYEMELEENVRRKEMHWTEETIAVAKIHSIKKRNAALDRNTWGQQETARLLGLDSHCTVSYALRIAERLNASKEDVLWKCDNAWHAWQTIMTEQTDVAQAELARRQHEAAQNHAVLEVGLQEIRPELLSIDTSNEMPIEGLSTEIMGLRNTPYDELTKDQAHKLYESNPLNPLDKFEEYYTYKLKQIEARNTISLSSMMIHGDSIAYMNDPLNAGRFNHIITDIPYGIDMDMLQQDNQGMDVSSTAKEHDVEGNMDLIRAFFPAAYRATDERAFVITWCDAMLFSWMHSRATECGFAVQRWPFHWVKPQGMNNAAQYNQTKATEIAIICRKPGATRVELTGLNYECCPKDELCDLIDHPFAKPYRLWERLTSEVSIEGQLILEPFMGRGSGVISMLRMKRNVIGVELNEAHYNAARFNVANQHFLKLNPKLKFI